MPRRTARFVCAPLAALLLSVAAAAFAHKPGDSYLTLRVVGAEVTGQWDVALRDLDLALGLVRRGRRRSLGEAKR